jgi:hypothetical protein
MSLRHFAGIAAIFCLASLHQSGVGCSLCESAAGTATLREDAASARLIVYGTLSNPRFNAAVHGAGSDGAATDLAIERVLKAHAVLGGQRVLTLPRYVPVDASRPTKFLVFCDVVNGRLDPFRGCPASPALVEYVAGALRLEPAAKGQQFAYFGRFIDHAEPEVAADAFREFAKAGDLDITLAAKQLDPAQIRKLLVDVRTPPERLTLFAYMLGGCGTPADADLLRDLIRRSDDRSSRAIGGLLAGYTQLRPDDGWKLLLGGLADPRQPFPRRLAMLGTVRFFYQSQPMSRSRAVGAVVALLPQGDMADLAVEDLRRWHEWGPCSDVLSHFDKKTHAAPMVRRAIVRYAINCPRPEARQFVERLRRADPELVRDVEQSLEFEKPVRPPA